MSINPVGQGPKWQPGSSGKPPAGDYGPDQSAVKGHAPVPYGNNFKGMMDIIRSIHVLVEEDISQSGPYHKPDNKVEDKVLDQPGGQAHGSSFFLVSDQEIGSQEGDHIHEPIRADLYGPVPDRYQDMSWD